MESAFVLTSKLPIRKRQAAMLFDVHLQQERFKGRRGNSITSTKRKAVDYQTLYANAASVGFH